MSSRPNLVVFSDDWGRHPSSCQHLVRQLLPGFRVFWVNTIGTRLPGLDRLAMERGLEKMRGWLRPPGARTAGDRSDSNPQVLDPLMWPSFRGGLGRRVNRWLLTRSLQRSLPRGERCVGITTIPLTADLVGSAPVDRWLYYCVDDLSSWPGLDRRSLEKMERDLVLRVDAIIAVSDHLVGRMGEMGRSADLLTHGLDLEHWQRPEPGEPAALADLPRPLMVFWGVVDRRLDVDWLRQLSGEMEAGSIVLIGPANNPDPELDRLERVVRTGPLPYADLPQIGQAAAVLIMPYADLPATRAIQPLKLKEYLATGRPVVSSDLPAVREWRDACDVVGDAGGFCEAVWSRLRTGVPENQHDARSRLRNESWQEKARLFEQVLTGRSRTGDVATDRVGS